MDNPAIDVRPMGKQETIQLGIVLERRCLDHPWKDHAWVPVDVIPGAPARDPHGEWLLLKEGEGWARYHSGTLPLELFRKETDAYKLTLAQVPPRVFVVMREDEDAGATHEMVPFAVTASPTEAQDYLDSSEDIVESVPMPAEIVALVRDFIEQHHVDEPFFKRKRKRYDPDAAGGGRHG
ncbi:MAG: DUF3305 domain-containing protein [Alphaproteobacteria bacterium]